MKKVKSFQASDGQLFLDGGKLVTHELKQVISKAAANIAPVEIDNIASALVSSHAVLFDALKLLKTPTKRAKKGAATAATPAASGKK